MTAYFAAATTWRDRSRSAGAPSLSCCTGRAAADKEEHVKIGTNNGRLREYRIASPD